MAKPGSLGAWLYVAFAVITLAGVFLTADLRTSDTQDKVSSRHVTLSDRDGTRTLTYDCGAFLPQARDAADTPVLAFNLGAELKRLRAGGDTVTLMALAGAAQANDWPRIEAELVKARCAVPSN